MMTLTQDAATYRELKTALNESEQTIFELQAAQDVIHSQKQGHDLHRALLEAYEENEAIRDMLAEFTLTNHGLIRTMDIGDQPMTEAMKPLTTAEKEAQRVERHIEALVRNGNICDHWLYAS